jgi:hypothetical protein
MLAETPGQAPLVDLAAPFADNDRGDVRGGHEMSEHDPDRSGDQNLAVARLEEPLHISEFRFQIDFRISSSPNLKSER